MQKSQFADEQIVAILQQAEKRALVRQATERGMSQRQACRLVKVIRSSVHYVAHPRFGSPRIHALLAAELKAEGKTINHKRVERIWRKCGLQVPQRPKKRKIKTGRMVPPQAEHPNHVWSYDFQADALVSGRKLRLSTS